MKLQLSFLLVCFAFSNIQAELVAHWPLDTDAVDATGNGHDGAVVGGTVNFGQTGANGNTGSAAAFPDNGHIDIPFAAALNPGSFTVALWVNSGPTAAHASPITSRDDAPGLLTHGYIIYHNPAGNWDFWTGDGDPGWDGLAGDPVTVNTWTHLAISYDAGTDTKTLYVNGAVSATDNVTPVSGAQYSPNGTVEMEGFHIGSGQDLGDGFFFDGLIDDVGVWDEALDVAVIQSVMTNGISSGLPDPALSAPDPYEITLDGGFQVFGFPITNEGQSQSLNISSATFNGDPNFSVATLPGPIAPGDWDNLIFSFDPFGANGEFSAELEITSNDSLVPTQTITVQGTIHDPMIVSDDTVDLGENTSGTLTVSNDGATRTLNISSIDIAGDDDHFEFNSRPTTIPAGGSDDIDITFDALGEEGSFSVTLTFTTDDPINPTFDVVVTAVVPFTETLVAWWPLDVDGTDASGNGFDGTIVGAPVASEGANSATIGSLDFDGASRIDVPFDSDLNPDSFTVTLWANADTTAGFASPITSRDDVGSGVTTHGFILYNNSGGSWDFWTGDGDPGWDTLAGDPVAIETWTHLAIAYDSATDTKTLYINGIESASDTVPQSGPTQYSPNGTVETEMLHIGAGQDDGLNFWFDGKIDDVGLFRVALPVEDIASIMTNGIAGYSGVSQSPEITDLALDSGNGNVTITFNSINDVSYIIERSTDLENWFELTDDHKGEGDSTSYTDTTVPNGTTKLFYRVTRL